jgi:hypothetical protein
MYWTKKQAGGFCEETSLTCFCNVNRFRNTLAVPIGLDLFLNREDEFST